jgi:nucleoside-diphosphate-sugar epimerase
MLAAAPARSPPTVSHPALFSPLPVPPSHAGAVNIACPQYVSVNELVVTVAEAAGKKIEVNCVDGPVGVQSRNFSNERIYSTGWRPRVFLREGIGLTYPWIEAQVREWAKRRQASS